MFFFKNLSILQEFSPKCDNSTTIFERGYPVLFISFPDKKNASEPSLRIQKSLLF
jgi:hypothetical protein